MIKYIKIIKKQIREYKDKKKDYLLNNVELVFQYFEKKKELSEGETKAKILHGFFNKDNFLVLPINLDRGPKKNAINFFKTQNINNLKIYFDDKNEIPREVKILGLPVSIFISKEGKEIARLIIFQFMNTG